MRWPLIAFGLVLSAGPFSIVTAEKSDYSAKETRRLAYDYSRCVVGRHPAAASQALLSNVDNKTFMRQYGSLIDGNCLVRATHAGTKMSFPGDLYRYALADALVARELASTPVPELSNVPPLERAALPAEPASVPANASKPDRRKYEQSLKNFTEAQSFRALAELGECVVRLNTAGAKALLLTVPETADETSAFDALRPTLAQCLPEGRTLSLGKLVLRGTVAVNYYRLAHAVRPVPTAGTPAHY
jgi:hypothetical protein